MTDPSEDDARSTYWYCQIGGREMGPMLMSRLRQMARKGGLSADDMVRRGTSGDWVSAADVEGLTVSKRAKPIVAPKQASPKEKEYAADPNAMEGFFSSFKSRILDLYYDSGQILHERLGLLRKIAAWLVLAFVAVALLSFVAPRNPFERLVRADPYETYKSIWSEVQDKRTNKASDAEWNEFSAKSEHKLAPIIARLEKEANSTNRLAQQLLWAGRDCLLVIIKTRSNAVDDREKRFEEHMNNVALLLDNKPLYGGDSGAFRPGGYQPPVARSWYSGDWTTTIFATVMVVLDVGIVLWFVRVWRKKSR